MKHKQWLSVLVLGSFLLFAPRGLPAASGIVDTGETFQVMAGFGASIAWYDYQLVNHPSKEEIYYYIFSELGLDILRLKNGYGKDNISYAEEIVQQFWDSAYMDPIVMLSSWSPPANLKSNGRITDGGTLIKEDGTYAYEAFARYWMDALDAYDDMNVLPDYISIQNEPSYTAQWESCILRESESATYAGYPQALEAVYNALQERDNPPKILAPEVLGIGYSLFQKYANQFDHERVDAYAFHLYHGEADHVGDNHDPDQFIPNLSKIADSYPDKPVWQTEYDRGDWFNTVWLMHNCLVHGNTSAYLYWYLVSSSTGGHALVHLENHSNPYTWTTDDGFILNKEFWAFRQYALYIDRGYSRIMAEADPDDVRISAFLSPEGDYLTVVILNVGESEETLNLDIAGFDVENMEIVRTTDDEDAVKIDADNRSIPLPVRSITTVFFEGEKTGVSTRPVPKPVRFRLGQNRPNPFNPSTRISYLIHESSRVGLSVYNIQGQKVRTLVDEVQAPGSYKVGWDGRDDANRMLPAGVYVYRLSANSETTEKKMILLD